MNRAPEPLAERTLMVPNADSCAIRGIPGNRKRRGEREGEAANPPPALLLLLLLVLVANGKDQKQKGRGREGGSSIHAIPFVQPAVQMEGSGRRRRRTGGGAGWRSRNAIHKGVRRRRQRRLLIPSNVCRWQRLRKKLLTVVEHAERGGDVFLLQFTEVTQ